MCGGGEEERGQGEMGNGVLTIHRLAARARERGWRIPTPREQYRNQFLQQLSEDCMASV